MTAERPIILYIHGFNSSPASEKARLTIDYCQQQGRYDVAVPELSFDPRTAMDQLEREIAQAQGRVALLVGSSLGGYYATWLAERHGIRAALVNPAVSPCQNLGDEFLGAHTNMYTGETYEITMEHVDFLSKLDIDPITCPGLFFLLVQTGDEVLDYRLAVSRYAGARQLVQEGGNHSFENYSGVIPEIVGFAA